MKKFIFISLLFSVGSAGAQGIPSPVGIVDFLGWGSSLDRFEAVADARAFREFTYIIYDNYIQRPWGNAYGTELNNRWADLRKFLCPSLVKFCSLPGIIVDGQGFMRVVWGLMKPEVRNELREHFAKSQNPYYLDFLYFPESGEAVPSLLFSGKESQRVIPVLNIWDMSATQVIEKDKEYIMTHDLESYGGSFSMEKAPTYFALNETQIIINIDKIKTQAAEFGKIWQSRIESLSKDQGQISEPKVSNFEEYMLWALYQERLKKFDEIYNVLLVKVKALPGDQAKQLIGQFEKARAQNAYPEEVFEHVAYDMFLPLVQMQAQYFLLAQNDRTNVGMKRKIWESLLTMQTQLDPKLLFYFTFVESAFPKNTILNQMVGPSVAPAFFFEEIKAILGMNEFVSNDLYSKYKYTLKAKDLFSRDYLEREVPDLAKELTDGKTGEIKDVFSFDEAGQRQVFAKYLANPKGEIRLSSVFRLMISVAEFIGGDDSRQLAKIIHETRKQEFGNPQH